MSFAAHHSPENVFDGGVAFSLCINFAVYFLLNRAPLGYYSSFEEVIPSYCILFFDRIMYLIFIFFIV